MGYRLEGPRWLASATGELISEPVAIGALQVPAAGEPILLMADRQTTGGYPKIATVITADLPLAGQLAPGDAIGSVLCSRQEAVTALIARERQLLRSRYLEEQARECAVTAMTSRVRRRPRRRADAPLAPLTTFKVGGPADVLVEPVSAEDIVQALKLAQAAWRAGDDAGRRLERARLPMAACAAW